MEPAVRSQPHRPARSKRWDSLLRLVGQLAPMAQLRRLDRSAFWQRVDTLMEANADEAAALTIARLFKAMLAVDLVLGRRCDALISAYYELLPELSCRLSPTACPSALSLHDMDAGEEKAVVCAVGELLTAGS